MAHPHSIKPSFGWKKSNKLQSTLKVFSEESAEFDELKSDSESCRYSKRSSKIVTSLCDAALSKQLKEEGADLASDDSFFEALEKWNEAIRLAPNDEKLYEMKAQVLMIQEQDFTAVKCAEQAVRCNSLWFVGWLTLGRAQMNLKDFAMAKKSFSRALHLNPCESDIRLNDLHSAVTLFKKSEEPT